MHRLTLIAVILSALTLLPSRSAQAQAISYIGNRLVPNGGADGDPPLVILGEYSSSGPLATSVTTLPAGTVQNVKFYGQNYNFTLYALSRVGAGPHTNEQTFEVVAAESFSGSTGSPGTQTVAVSSFCVNAGDFLGFAGIGPYYESVEDAANSDATYEDSSSNGFFTATPPGGPGSEFTVGVHPDTNAAYQYISNVFSNQGRHYSIGVDVFDFQITSIVRTNANDLLITWNTTGTNNLVQVTAGTGAGGSFSTNGFADVTNIVITTATTNFVDVGALTNKPARYYRIWSRIITLSPGSLPSGCSSNVNTNTNYNTNTNHNTNTNTNVETVSCDGTNYTVTTEQVTEQITQQVTTQRSQQETPVFYDQTILAGGGSAPYTFAVTGGALPAGLTLASSGALSGFPTTPGTTSFTVTATDANGSTGSATYSLTFSLCDSSSTSSSTSTTYSTSTSSSTSTSGCM